MPNQVTLTFGSDIEQASKGFKTLGDDAEKMGKKVGESAGGFDTAAEAADGAEGKAQGFSDVLTGTADTAGGFSQIMKGNLFDGFVQVGQGLADLSGGFADFLIPALQKSKIATLAQTAASKAAALGTNIWNGAQKLFNLTLLTSPITWIVLGIVALIAVIVLIATKTTWFQTLWKKSWSGIKAVASDVWDFLKKIPGWTQSAFGKVASFISAPYRAAFNLISRAWNNTIGGLSFTFPSWIPGIGGNGFSVPNLPTFHSGGVIPGVAGTPVTISALAGERVSGLAGSQGGNGGTIIVPDGPVLGALVDALANAVRGRGATADVLGIKLPRTA